MLVSQKQNLQRALDRLQIFINDPQQKLADVVPAFFYTSDLLKKYSLKQFNNRNQNQQYFQKFNNCMKKFIKNDINSLKIHEQEISNEILQFFNSQLYLASLHPQHKFFKKASIDIALSEIEPSSFKKTIQKKDSSLASQFWAKHSQPQGATNLKQSREIHFSNIHKGKVKKTVSQIRRQDASNLLNQIKFEYDQHKIDEAHQLVQQYYAKRYPMSPEVKNHLQSIEKQYNQMISMINQLDRPGWKFQKSKNGIIIQSLLVKDDPLAGIKMQSQFQIPIQNIMAILCQMDLMKQYTPFCHDSRLIKRPARNKVLGYCQISIPFLSERQACIHAVGYDRIAKNGTIFMVSRSIDDPQQIEAIEKQENIKFPKSKDGVNLKYKYFLIEYTPVSVNKARVRIASKVDMQINFVPQFIMKSSALTFGFDYFTNIKQINRKFDGSAWDQKMQQNPDLYNFFIDKISEYNISTS